MENEFSVEKIIDSAALSRQKEMDPFIRRVESNFANFIDAKNRPSLFLAKARINKRKAPKRFS